MRPEHAIKPVMPLMKRTGWLVVLAASLLSFAPSPLLATQVDALASPSDLTTSTSSTTVQTSVEKQRNPLGDIRQYLGIRYRFGGDSPAGFDCSGFVRFLFSKELNVELPHSSRAMSEMGKKVERNELRPGDLVFFKNSRNRINHVGIFVGNDAFIHASLSRGIARDTLSESYFRKRFATAVRLLDLPDDQLPQPFDLPPGATEQIGSPS